MVSKYSSERKILLSLDQNLEMTKFSKKRDGPKARPLAPKLTKLLIQKKSSLRKLKVLLPEHRNESETPSPPVRSQFERSASERRSKSHIALGQYPILSEAPYSLQFCEG